MNNRREGEVIVEAGPLRKALSNKASLVALNRAIGIALGTENAATTDSLATRWERDKIPSTASRQRTGFFGNSGAPFVGIRASKRNLVRGWVLGRVDVRRGYRIRSEGKKSGGGRPVTTRIRIDEVGIL
jgi:hypothetical protein